jgi:DNA-binding response OmpR family regulator
MNVLIVEDDTILSFVTSKYVTNMGYNVAEIIDNGEDAIEYILKHNPDLVLMDIQLIGTIDGVDVVNRVRLNNFSNPVIFLTGNSDLPNKKRMEMITNSQYLIKPVEIEDLKFVVENIVKKQKVT